MTSILDLILAKPSYQIAKEIVKKSKTNWRETKISIFQFFIDFFGKEFKFTEEHYDNINESTINLQAFVLEIHDSRNTNEESIEPKLFIQHLMNELFFADFLSGPVVSSWVTFLASIAEHETIPKITKMKANAHLLLIYMLVPFSKLMALFGNPEADINEDLKTAIARSIERIFNLVPMAFEYEKHSLACAKEYSEVLITYHEILLQDSTYLKHYHSMLKYDSRPLLSTAIKSIESLCSIEDIEVVMREFLFTSQNNEQTIAEIIMKLINFKNLRLEVIGCLKAITKFEGDHHEIIKSDSYAELFVNLFSKSKKTVAETAELMVSLEINFWLEFIKVLNYYTSDDNVDIKFILMSIEPSVDTNIKNILEIVVNNINEPIISRRGAEILNVAFEMSCDKEEHLASLIDALQECKEDEMTFTILLQSFISIDDEMLVSFLKENVNYLIQILMPTISNAFLIYKKDVSIHSCVTALRKLYAIEPISILVRVRDIASEFSKNLLDLTAVEFKEREIAVPKLSALFECKSWRLVNDDFLVNLYDFCQRHCTNTKYNYFPQFQRFYINILKHFWMLIAVKKSIPLEKEKFIKKTINIHTQISYALKCPKNSIQDNCLLLSSLIDLHVLFPPKMTESLDNQFFKGFNFKLSKEDFIRMIDMMEQNLFPETEDACFYQQMLIQSFTVLFKNFINLPSLTSWEVLLRYYNSKSLYKAEIEVLMTYAISMKKTIFEKAVAFAMLNISAMGGFEGFRQFFHAFDEFMRKTYADYKTRNIVYGVICSIVLERFPRQITTDDSEEHTDRLKVLDCIGLVVKNSDQISKNLLKFVKVNENLLTDIEIRKLNDFKRMLANEEMEL